MGWSPPSPGGRRSGSRGRRRSGERRRLRGFGITCDPPRTARSAAILFFFFLDFRLYSFLCSAFPPPPAFLGEGGRRSGNVPNRTVKSAQRVQLLGVLLCCVFASCLSVNVCLRTRSSTSASQRFPEKCRNRLAIQYLNLIQTVNHTIKTAVWGEIKGPASLDCSFCKRHRADA